MKTPEAVPSYGVVRELSNQRLGAMFEIELDRAGQIDLRYQRLWREMATLGLSGGKRLRPYLAAMGYYGFGGRNLDLALSLGTALEVLHLSLLIHDDIVDRAAMRYGVPTIEQRYRRHYRSRTIDRASTDHAALGAALLAGDLGLTTAHRLMADLPTTAGQRAELLQLLSELIHQVMAGQLLDSEIAFRPSTADDSLRVAELKTASYSCIYPLVMGATLAGATLQQREPLQTFGYHFGIAYQLRDDLLGVFGEEATTGKSTLSDVRDGKRTYLMQLGLRLADPRQRRQLNAILGNPKATQRHVQHIQGILEVTGAKSAVTDMIIRQTELGQTALTASDLTDAVRARLQALAQDMLRRTT